MKNAKGPSLESTPSSDGYEQAEGPIPVLAAPQRKDTLLSNSTTVIRDFAYLFDDIRFHNPAEPPDPSPELDHDEEEDEPHPVEDGFTGVPPWMQLSTHGGMASEDDLSITSKDELYGRAVALFDFIPEHENEFALSEGQIIHISSRHGQGWLVAVEPDTGDCGLVPEEYVRMLNEEEINHSEGDQGTALAGKHEATSGQSAVDAEGWVDESDSDGVTHQGKSSEVECIADPDQITEEDRRKIMLQAERDMAIAEHENMDGL